MAVHRIYTANRRKERLSQRWKMELEANQVSRDWTILHEGRTFYVNYTDSDGQSLALCNRDNWQIFEETDEDTEKLDIYGFNGDLSERQKTVEENIRLAEELIKFCIENWDNKFMQEIKKELQQSGVP